MNIRLFLQTTWSVGLRYRQTDTWIVGSLDSRRDWEILCNQSQEAGLYGLYGPMGRRIVWIVWWIVMDRAKSIASRKKKEEKGK